MTRRKIDTLTVKEQFTLYRLVTFAKRNNLKLFNVKGSLYDRIRTITNDGGKCTCFPGRPHCPCAEVIQECKENGECFCRVFVTPRHKE